MALKRRLLMIHPPKPTRCRLDERKERNASAMAEFEQANAPKNDKIPFAGIASVGGCFLQPTFRDSVVFTVC